MSENLCNIAVRRRDSQRERHFLLLNPQLETDIKSDTYQKMLLCLAVQHYRKARLIVVLAVLIGFCLIQTVVMHQHAMIDSAHSVNAESSECTPPPSSSVLEPVDDYYPTTTTTTIIQQRRRRQHQKSSNQQKTSKNKSSNNHSWNVVCGWHRLFCQVLD